MSYSTTRVLANDRSITVTMLVCDDCGAVVWNQQVHDKFHLELIEAAAAGRAAFNQNRFRLKAP